MRNAQIKTQNHDKNNPQPKVLQIAGCGSEAQEGEGDSFPLSGARHLATKVARAMREELERVVRVPSG